MRSSCLFAPNNNTRPDNYSVICKKRSPHCFTKDSSRRCVYVSRITGNPDTSRVRGDRSWLTMRATGKYPADSNSKFVCLPTWEKTGGVLGETQSSGARRAGFRKEHAAIREESKQFRALSLGNLKWTPGETVCDPTSLYYWIADEL